MDDTLRPLNLLCDVKEQMSYFFIIHMCYSTCSTRCVPYDNDECIFIIFAVLLPLDLDCVTFLLSFFILVNIFYQLITL